MSKVIAGRLSLRGFHFVLDDIDTPLSRISKMHYTSFSTLANGNPYLQLTSDQPPLPFTYKLLYQTQWQNTKLYALILHARIDRESRSLYDRIQLLAYDSGTPTLHTRLPLTLNVTDVNDCVPRILTTTTLYDVEENNPVGLIIDTLNGSDCDLGINAQFEYRLLNRTDLLQIDARTGQLSLNQSIDFERLQHEKNQTTLDLEYVIEIQDLGQPPLSSQTRIVLRLHDLNDNAPVFDQSQSYNWTFSTASLRRHSILGRTIAHDQDSGLNGVVSYSIRSLDPCLSLSITSLGYIHLPVDFACALGTYQFELIAHDSAAPTSRSTKQWLTISIHSNDTQGNPLPKLMPLSTQRTMVDVNSLGQISFIIDITNNQSVEPRISLNNTNLLSCWNISSTGEVRLMGQPYAHTYRLLLHVIDAYSSEHSLTKLQIDLCNSSRPHSCQLSLPAEEKKENQVLLVWAMALAFLITCLCVFLCSIITCVCCRKPARHEKKCLKFHDDFHSSRVSVQTTRPSFAPFCSTLDSSRFIELDDARRRS